MRAALGATCLEIAGTQVGREPILHAHLEHDAHVLMFLFDRTVG
jgi:hypothetical protein